MPAQAVQYFRIELNGGLSTERSPFAVVGVETNNTIRVPYLTRAENIQYRTSGAWQKVGGAEIMNATALGDPVILAMWDYWALSGVNVTAGTQQLVVRTEDAIYTIAPSTGIATEQTTGLAAATIHMTQFDDLLIVCSDDDTAPQKWDGAAFGAVGTNTPNIHFSEEHKNYLFGAGVDADESTLFHSQYVTNGGPDGDWDGASAGVISISPDDGDKITAIVSHNDKLFIFKGPYKGSIHILEGSSTAGDDVFRLRPLIKKGLGAVHQNSIFRYRNDVGFLWSDGTVHSLEAVETAGDFYMVQLSRDIDKYIKDNAAKDLLHKAWAVSHVETGEVKINIPLTGSATPNQCIALDYRFQEMRWAFQAKIATTCMINYVDTANGNERIILSGGTDGYVRRLNRPNRRYEDTPSAYSGMETVVDYPFIDFGSAVDEKTLMYASASFKPKGTATAQFRWTRDEETTQTRNFNQDGGATLDNFTLGMDVLGGASGYATRFMHMEDGGKFRSLALGVRQLALNEDIELYALGVAIKPAGKALTNVR